MNEIEFVDQLGTEFKLDPTPSLTQNLIELGLDSVDMINLIVYIEELASIDGELDGGSDFPVLRSVGDAYTYYRELVDSDQTHTGSEHE
jgi:acyl carrier protein